MNDVAVAATQPAEHAKWNPTSAEMHTYISREVELCMAAIKRGAATAQTHTLYSQRTWDEAVVRLGGMPAVDPKDTQRIEAIRAAATAAADARGRFNNKNRNGFGTGNGNGMRR